MFPFSSLSVFDSNKNMQWSVARKPLLCTLHRWKCQLSFAFQTEAKPPLLITDLDSATCSQ